MTKLEKIFNYKTVFLALILSLVFNQVYAQFEIRKHTINNGTGEMIGGSYEMRASIGQVDASSTQIGGSFSLSGGFWQENNDLIFKNGLQ